MVRSMLNLSHHLISWRLGLHALKAKQGILPFLSNSQRDSGVNLIDS
jgi:hypothetical protein